MKSFITKVLKILFLCLTMIYKSFFNIFILYLIKFIFVYINKSWSSLIYYINFIIKEKDSNILISIYLKID